MRHKVPMSAPEIDEVDIQAVVEVLRSGRLALGAKADEFEDAMCEYVGTSHAIAVSSGTAALHLIVRAMGLGHGDEVLVPSFTFAASVNVLLYEGVTPVFVDIEPLTYNIDCSDLERKITPQTKAILAVDAFGHPADWDTIGKIAARHRLLQIDDSCEALGAELRGRKIGQFGDAAAFAFYPNKQITAGEGGMVVTNDEELARLARSLRNQGRGEMGSWLEYERLGYNYRMDEMSAALGLSQIKRIEQFLALRERVAQLYTSRLLPHSFLRVPVTKPQTRMSWFVYVIALEEGIDRKIVIEGLANRGVPARCYFSPIHRQAYIPEIVRSRTGELITTDSIAQRTLALPFHNRMAINEIDEVVAALSAAIDESFSVLSK